jgi:hypothetical protein
VPVGIEGEAQPTGTFDPYASTSKRKSTGMRGKGTAKAGGSAKLGPAQRNGRRYKAK